MTLFSNPVWWAYAQVFFGAGFNLITAFMLKKAEGFTVFWPSVIALASICMTQFLLSRAMQSGLDMGLSITLVVVTVMVGSCAMGIFWFDDAVSAQKIAGLTLAVVGVAIASMAG